MVIPFKAQLLEDALLLVGFERSHRVEFALKAVNQRKLFFESGHSEAYYGSATMCLQEFRRLDGRYERNALSGENQQYLAVRDFAVARMRCARAEGWTTVGWVPKLKIQPSISSRLERRKRSWQEPSGRPVI